MRIIMNLFSCQEHGHVDVFWIAQLFQLAFVVINQSVEVKAQTWFEVITQSVFDVVILDNSEVLETPVQSCLNAPDEIPDGVVRRVSIWCEYVHLSKRLLDEVGEVLCFDQHSHKFMLLLIINLFQVHILLKYCNIRLYSYRRFYFSFRILWLLWLREFRVFEKWNEVF